MGLANFKPTIPFVRFLMVGFVNTMVGLSLIFILLNVLGVSYWQATFVGNLIGACISFILNRSFTFKSKVSFIEGFPLFLLVVITCYFVSYSLSAQVLEEKNLAVLLGAVLYTLTNYIGQKQLVFIKG
jgi:putative flippase GtrA